MHGADREIARIAGAQDNVITGEQLRAAGLGRGALEWRVDAGLLQRCHRGVYLVGPAPPTFRARARAAVLAAGPSSAVGRAAAQALLMLGPEAAGPIDIVVSGRAPRSRAGIVIHRSSLVRSEVIDVKGIPVTSPARTICDQAGTLTTPELEQLLIDARVARCVTDRELTAVITRAPHRRGSVRMRQLLADEAEAGYSRSRAERLLRRLISDADLPRPIFNQRFGHLLPDARWERQRLIVEVDGRRFHGHPTAYEGDRRRDQLLAAVGYRVIRVTWRQLTREPIAVAVRIGQSLMWSQAVYAA